MRTIENSSLSALEILSVAADYNTGGIEPVLVGAATDIEVLTESRPTSEWAESVDKIEADFAPDYDEEEYANQALNLMGLDEVEDMLDDVERRGEPEAQRLLDIGCGTGRLAVAAARRGVVVNAFDATTEYVQIAAAKARLLGLTGRISAVVATAEAYGYPNEIFDQATAMFGVLNHVENWVEVLPRIQRSLQEGGVFNSSYYGSNDALVFELINSGELSYDPSILVRRVDGGLQLGDEASAVLPANFPPPIEVAERLEAAGFEQIELTGRLLFSSLFPKDPTPANVEAYLNLVATLDQSVAKRIETLADQPTELLLAAYRIDLEAANQQQLDRYAYVGVRAVSGGAQ